jgi:hypothetical protein
VIYHGASDDEDDDALRGERPDAPSASSAWLDDPSLDRDIDDEVEEDVVEPTRESRRKRLERILPDLLKRAIEKGLETGIGTLTNSSDAIRGVVNKAEIPKEVASYLFSQVDDTKNAMVRVVAREVREFLEAADLAKEVQRALTSLSFEIRTEIRFKPNDAGGVTPQVKAEVGPRRSTDKPRRGLRRPSAPADAGDPGDPDDV